MSLTWFFRLCSWLIGCHSISNFVLAQHLFHPIRHFVVCSSGASLDSGISNLHQSPPQLFLLYNVLTKHKDKRPEVNFRPLCFVRALRSLLLLDVDEAVVLDAGVESSAHRLDLTRVSRVTACGRNDKRDVAVPRRVRPVRAVCFSLGDLREHYLMRSGFSCSHKAPCKVALYIITRLTQKSNKTHALDKLPAQTTLINMSTFVGSLS